MKRIIVRACARGLRAVGLDHIGWNLTYRHVRKFGGPAPRLVAAINGHGAKGVIVEHGCGIGDLPTQLPEGSFAEYRGYDISSESIKVANSQRLPRCRFAALRMEQWEGEDRPVSVIVCKEVLYYLSESDLRRFLERAIASLEPHGRLLATIDSPQRHADTVAVCAEFGAVKLREGAPMLLEIPKAKWASTVQASR